MFDDYDRGFVKASSYNDYKYFITHTVWISSGFNNAYYCGYVVIPEDHYLYKNEESYELDVHGGVTYANDRDYMVNADWVIGFDTGHAGDSPEVEDLDYVDKQCKYLIDQIIELERLKKKEKVLKDIGMVDFYHHKRYALVTGLKRGDDDYQTRFIWFKDEDEYLLEKLLFDGYHEYWKSINIEEFKSSDNPSYVNAREHLFEEIFEELIKEELF